MAMYIFCSSVVERCNDMIEFQYIAMKLRFSERNWRSSPQFRGLCDAFSSCNNEEEIANLLRDIGTLSELQSWRERLEVAKQLFQGKTYRQISENTGASTTTVTRVAKFMEEGSGGYKKYFSAKDSSNLQSEVEHKRSEPALKGYLSRAQK